MWLWAAAALSGLGACASPVQSNEAAAGQAPVRQIATSLGRLGVHEYGAGPRTLVLWPSILADHSIYEASIRSWQRTHRVIVVDGPGHGASGPAPAPFTMAQCAQALAEVLDALGQRAPVVVGGTSWGGLVAGEFAIAYPARTAGVVMLNTPVIKTEAGFADRFVTWGARWIHGSSLYSDGVARAFFLAATRERGGPVIERFHAHLHQANGAALALAVRSVLIDREDLASRMDRIAAPTLFVAGTHDDMYPLATLRAAVARLPHGRFIELPTAHISVVDAPQAVAQAVEEFLRSLPR